MSRLLLPAILFALSLTLLAAVRLDQPKQNVAHLVGSSESVKRGEPMRAGPKEMKAYTLNGTKIFLAENTMLGLVDSSDVPDLALVEGRVVTNGPIDISVRDTTIHVKDGLVTFVFYSWLDKLEVSSLGGSYTLYRNGQEIPASSTGFSIDTLNQNAEPVPTEQFQPAKSSAKEFYDWALNN